jgi:DNA-binding LacI/PurR family transcriptional regulator
VMVYGREAELSIEDASAREATSTLLAHASGRPTAIFCWRDETALLAMRECRRQGLRVPEDISIVGFSDISAARLGEVPLSTIRAPLEGIGRLAVQVLAQRLDEEFDPAPVTHLVPTTFVARASSGAAPQ